jgi:hypothetical protein
MDCFALLATTAPFVSWIASRCSQRRHLLSPGVLRISGNDGIFCHLECFALPVTTASFVSWNAARHTSFVAKD